MSHRPQNSFSENAAPSIDWDACMREHSCELRRWVAKEFGGEEGVDDVMQEVALASVKSTNPPLERDKILPWLKSVARHKVQDYWRKVGRERRIKGAVAEEMGASGYEWVLYTDRIETVREALDSLEPVERRLVVGKYAENQSCEQLALKEGMSPKSLEYQLSKARGKLRAKLMKLFKHEDEK